MQSSPFHCHLTPTTHTIMHTQIITYNLPYTTALPVEKKKEPKSNQEGLCMFAEVHELSIQLSKWKPRMKVF